MSRGELALAIGLRGTASPDPCLSKLEDFPCAEVAVAARSVLSCLSEVLCTNMMLRVLLLDLEGALSQIKVPAV